LRRLRNPVLALDSIHSIEAPIWGRFDERVLVAITDKR
jgi:hypothetical protein